MSTSDLPGLAAEVPAYAQLQREMHDALLAQHPEWILPSGESPTCDSYDQRFAELLTMSLATDRNRDSQSFRIPPIYGAGRNSAPPAMTWAMA